jgi:CRP/FNR family transcriptional regulator, anaerobic regulatory protein
MNTLSTSRPARALPTATVLAQAAAMPPRPCADTLPLPPSAADSAGLASENARRLRDGLALLEQHVPFTRRVVHAGDHVYLGGEAFANLHVINSGLFRSVKIASDGREQVVGLHFKGDWLGFDGIASGHYGCDAVAMDTGEVWSFRYDALLRACAEVPALMCMVHAAMSGQISRDRDSLLSLGTLPADARVADFLKYWAESLAARGLRTDQITLRMTRAEIGNYLGMTLETVSRALGRLARSGVIMFNEKGRRDISIPCVEALGDFIQSSLNPTPAGTLQ